MEWICVFPRRALVKCPVHEFSDGEFWGNMIMNDMKNWVSGWIYWNMILDQDGGPWLTSPIMVILIRTGSIVWS